MLQSAKYREKYKIVDINTVQGKLLLYGSQLLW